MKCKEFIKSYRNRQKHLVILIMSISLEFYIEGRYDIGHVLHLEFNVDVLLLILLDFINEVVVKLGF